jgi:hypothetical protein
MAGRGRTTFKKRQKEQLRLERRQQKAAKRLERKALKDNPPSDPGYEPQEPEDPADFDLLPIDAVLLPINSTRDNGEAPQGKELPEARPPEGTGARRG